MNCCVVCKSKKFAEILYGLQSVDDELEQAIKKKEIILGGCIITDHDPKWECNDCGNRWGEQDYD